MNVINVNADQNKKRHAFADLLFAIFRQFAYNGAVKVVDFNVPRGNNMELLKLNIDLGRICFISLAGGGFSKHVIRFCVDLFLVFLPSMRAVMRKLVFCGIDGEIAE